MKTIMATTGSLSKAIVYAFAEQHAGGGSDVIVLTIKKVTDESPPNTRDFLSDSEQRIRISMTMSPRQYATEHGPDGQWEY